MVTGFDIWGHDPGLRRHWRARALAFLMDALVVFLPVSAALYLAGMTDAVSVGLWNSAVFYLACAVPEMLLGATAGKSVTGLAVYGPGGGKVGVRAWARNVSKLFWFCLLPLDVVLGLATRGDPRQRLMDRLAGTKVVHRTEVEKHRAALEALTAGGATPPAGPEEAAPPDAAATLDMCRDCGGPLILLADGKLQCEDCGLIQ